MKVYDSLIRVSKMAGRVESAESTMTITDQRDANEYAIRAKGGQLGIEIMALDASGRTITESPQWRKALARVQSGESNGFAVAYSDRLSRNWRALGGFLDALEAAGGEVIIAGTNIDYRTDDGRAQTGMMAVMSDMAWSAASTRNKRIAEAALARGVPNRVPYGYRRNGTFDNKVLVSKIDPALDGKALVIDEGERADAVRLIFRMREARHSWVEIADALERQGVPSPSGKPRWVSSSMTSIVENRVYLGLVVLGDREPVAAHEILVTQAQWEAAQSVEKVAHNGNLLGCLALGLMTCSSCGNTMSYVGATTRGGERRVIYTCRRVSTGTCGRPMSVTQAPVDAWLERWVRDGLEGAEPFAVFATARELIAARAALDGAVAARKRIVVTAAQWDPEDAEAAYRAAKDAEVVAREHYDGLLARADVAAQLPESANAWNALELDDKRRVLRLLIARIEVAPPRSRSKFEPITDRLTLVERGGNA